MTTNIMTLTTNLSICIHWRTEKKLYVTYLCIRGSRALLYIWYGPSNFITQMHSKMIRVRLTTPLSLRISLEHAITVVLVDSIFGGQKITCII